MKILLDVGAHYGQTVEIALNPKWDFSTIHAFEPSKAAFQELNRFKSDKLRLHNFALFANDTSMTLYNSGYKNASLYSRPNHDAVSSQEEIVKCVNVCEWVRSNLRESDEVFMKLNCEGSEFEILTSLVREGLIQRFTSIYIDFDMRKVPSLSHRIPELINLLEVSRARYFSWETIYESLSEREKHLPYFSFERWLTYEVRQTANASFLDKFKYHLKVYLPIQKSINRLVRSIWISTKLQFRIK